MARTPDRAHACFFSFTKVCALALVVVATVSVAGARARAADNEQATPFIGQGEAAFKKGDLRAALAAYDRAVEVASTDPRGFVRRANVRFIMGDLDGGLADAESALALRPDDPKMLQLRATAYMAKEQWAAALADLGRAMEKDPGFSAAYVQRARIWATAPDAKYRDGARAVADAKKACDLSDWKDTDAVAVYAAAHAENGDFAMAVKWQKRVLADAGYMRMRGDVSREQLRLYEAKEPFRFPPMSKPGS